MKTLFTKRLFNIPFILLFTFLLSATVMAETYTATTMRLLHYEGTVEIVDSSGKSSLVMENIRFNSGDSLQTGAASSASVGMDSTKIVTLDENTKVEFTKQSNAMKLSLSEGSFFLDVSEKLKDNESLDIKTSTMTVGIRGTIVLVSTIPIEEYQNRLSLRTEGGQTPSNQAPSSQASGDQAGTGSISLSSLEEKIMQASADGGVVSMIGVLEGNVQMDYRDETGNNVKLDISSGQKATLLDSNENGMVDVKPEVKEVTAEDIFGAADKQIQSDPVIQERMQKAGVNIPTGGNTGDASSYPANGDWTVTSPVTVVAQSASKMFDGSPLTRSTDVLVQGLPKGFTCRATAGGSRTDAGSGENPISSCVIYNQQRENVTSHFTNIQKVSGKLTIDPAPLTAWSGSAEKVYDGTPLTSTETKLTFSPGYEKISYARKNLSYVITEKASVIRRGAAAESAAGSNNSAATAQSPQSSQTSQQSEHAQSSPLNESQTLYGICGTVLVHGSNPLTEEIKEINLSAGQRLTVFLSDKNNEESIDYVIETITEDEVPEDILRIYADNPEILTQACTETGWNVEKLNERIKLLPPLVTASSDVNGVKMNSQTTDNLMEDCTNVRITIDTEVTNYNDRALNKEEAHYTPMKADPSIKIVPNASITDVGTVSNTFTIDWGSAHKDNYKLSEQYGTLTVTPAPATVTTGSAEKEYDGTPLTNSEASISGLVNGETAAVTATGSITNVGSKSNSYSIDWGSAKEKNYSVSSNTGTLKVTASKAEVSIRISVAGKTYDGKPLDIDTVVTSDDSGDTIETASVQSKSITAKASSTSTQDGTSNTVSVKGLPSGFTLKAHITGSRTDAGTSELSIESYQIYDESGKDVTDHFSNVEIVESTLTIDPAPAAVTTGSASKEFDGTPLTSSEASISGLVDADKDTVKVNSTGSITDVGSIENTYVIDWGAARSSNYTMSENIGTLEVTENSTEITFTAPSGSKTYDGNALQAEAAGDVTSTGLPEGFTFTASASGSQTNAGSSETTVVSYKILNGDEKDVTANFTNIKTEKGTLTVNPAAATLTTGSSSKEYDGKALTSSEASITGLTDADKAAVTLTTTGTITDVGTTDNTYTIDWGEAKSSNYTLSESLGSLEVTANSTEITFKAASSSKTYDGTALTDETVSVDGVLPADHFTVFEVTGSQTDVGNSDNTVSSYKILDASEKDVTAYFSNIKTEKGSLTVNPAAAAVTTGSASKEYDGKELTSAEASITGLTDADKAAVTLTTTGTITDVGTTDNTYTIDWGEAKSSNYTLSESLGSLEVTANSTEITFKAASSSKTYDGTALTDETVSVDGVLPADHFTVFEVTGSQTDVGNSDNTVSSYKILDASEKDVTAYFTNIKTEKGSLTVNPAAAAVATGSASKEYDGKALTSSEASITGLADADKAAVTVTTTGTITNVGTTENTYIIDWGEAKSSNYTLSESLGTLEVTANNTEITFKAASSSKAYDGTALTDETVSVDGELPTDLLTVFEVTGSQTDVGSSANIISSYKILNAAEEDVTEYFTNIKTEKGTLTVSSATVTVTTESKSKAYDGTPLQGTVSISGLADAEKDKVTVTATASITDVGSTESTYSINWGTVNSSNYTLSENIGTLEITKNNTEITFTSASAEKVYDGSPLIVTDVTVKGLPEGFTYICSGGGPVDVSADAGTYENYFNDMNYTYTDENGVMWEGWRYAVIKNADGEDVTDNFSNIKFVRGTLTIHPLIVSIDLKSPVINYDGRTHGSTPSVKYGNGPKKGEDITIYTMMSNDAGDCNAQYNISDDVRLAVSTGGGGPDAGTHTLPCTYGFSGDVNTNNYTVNITGNTLTINKITAVVTTGSATGPSGTMYPVTSDEASITGLADADVEYVTITATGEQWSVGSSDNTYSIEWGTDDHPVNKDNYIIDEHLGTLTMFNAVITPPEGSLVPSKNKKTDNPADPAESGSAAEKDETADKNNKEADTGNNEKDAAAGTNEKDSATETNEKEAAPGNTEKDTATESNDDSSSASQSGDDSKDADQAADKSDQASEHSDSKEDKKEQQDQASESKNVKEDKTDPTSDSTDSKEEKSDQNSESKESREDQSKQASEDKTSKKDQSKKTSQSAEKAETKKAESTEKKDPGKDSSRDAAPAEAAAKKAEKEQKDSEE